MEIANNKIVDYLKALLHTFMYYIAFAIFQFSFFSFFKKIDENFISFSYLFASIILLFVVYFYYKRRYLGLNLMVNKFKYYWIILLMAPIFNRFNFYFWKYILNTNSPIRITNFVWLEELTLIFGTIFIIPFVEEMFFRGIILDKLLLKSKSNIVPIIFTSLLFSSIHIVSVDILGVYTILSTFTFSIIASVLYAKFRNIYYVIFFHLIYNLTWYIFRFYFINNMI